MDRFADRYRINTRWLIKLRWVAIIGQLLTIVVTVWLFQIQIPTIWPLIAAIAVTVASNLILAFWFSRSSGTGQTDAPWDLILGIVLMMDLFSLTTLLFATGGPNNPFSLFFFVNVSLSALVLNRNWAWALNVMSILCFAFLLFDHYPIERLDLGLDSIRGGNASLQHIGLLVAFAACSSVIVYFMNRLTDEVRQQQTAVRRAEESKARFEKIEALGTVTAAAAH